MSAAAEGYRYPGSHPFQDSDLDRVLFQGRETEALTLLHLILSERLVVLFGKSGIGKSSLLNAGVFQPLRERGFRPITVRLNDPERLPAARILDEARLHAEDEGGDSAARDTPTLWQYFKSAEFWSDDDVLLTPVLVLDQFEELFTTYSESERRLFAAELAELVRGHALRQVAQPMEGQRVPPGAEVPPNVKVVISIREDSLAELDELTASIPNILSCRYRLTPLAPHQARRAIVEPAQTRVDEIGIPAFEYEDRAVDDIIAFLSRERTRTGYLASSEIEPFQLQLLCKHVESRVVELQKKAGTETVVVRARDLGGDAGMQNIMQNFYDAQIQKLSSWREQWRVRRLFEKRLIHRGTMKRVSLPEEVIVDSYKVSKDILERLIGLRLVRVDPRARSNYYELSHDTLVEPVLRSARRRSDRYAIAAQLLLVVAIVVFAAVQSVLEGQHASFEQGTQYLLAGEHDAAVSEFREAIAQGDSSPYVFASLGDALFGGEKYSEAFDYYRIAASRDSTLRLKFADQGFLLSERKRYDESVRYLSEAVRFNSLDPAVHNNLGAALAELGKHREALPHYRRAFALGAAPNAMTYSSFGLSLTVSGLHDEAVRACSTAIRLDSTLASAHSNLGIALRGQGRYGDAIRASTRSLELDSMNAPAHNNVGAAYNALRQYSEAVPHLERAVQLDTAYAEAFNNLGVALEARQRRGVDIEKAIEKYRRAIQLDSAYVSPYVNLGNSLNWLGEYNQAIAYLTQAIRLDSGRAAAYNGAGFALGRTGRYRDAVTYLSRAIELNGKFSNAYNHRGYSRLKLNEFPNALEDFQTALGLNPNYGGAHAGLACWHGAQGRVEEAFRSLRRARELGYDDFPWMRRDSCFASLRSDPRFGQLLAGPVRRQGSG